MIEPGYILSERYKLLKTLGEGGMANVYLAHDLILDRDVAVKVLRLDLQNDPDTKRRFQREAMATTELVHPNIVSIYDVGESNGQQYLVMEYVRGSDLKKYIVEHFPIPYQRVIDIMEQILAGIQVAHDHNIIHRDLKPQNIMIDENGNAKITDFGIAVALSDNSMTQTNSLLGSVHYLSPEQARGSMPTKQSDIYALGIILFEMLTGTVPFEGDSAVSIALKHFQEEMPSVRDFDPRIPQALENVVLKATSKDPANRYTSASAMAADLKTSLSSARAHEPKYVPASTDLDETKVVPAVTPTSTSQTVEAASQAPLPSKVKPKAKAGWKKWWPLIALGALALFVVVMLILAFSGGKSDATVPDLSGMTQSQAESALESADLELGQVTKQSSSKVAKNRVIRSDPAAGKPLKTDRKVAIVLSTGVKHVKLANYVGRKYTTIKKQLVKAGLVVKRRNRSSSEVAAGYIIDQTPAAKRVKAGSKVTFIVSSGPRAVEMPDFSDQSEGYFMAWAIAHGMSPKVNHVNDDAPKDAFVSQDPASGTILHKGDVISINVSKGPAAASSSTAPSTSSDASSSSSQPTTKTVTKTLTVAYQPAATDSSSGSSGANTITIYIQDSKHSLSTVYKTMTISSDTQVQLSFELENGDTGAYRILNNGQVVQSEDNIGG